LPNEDENLTPLTTDYEGAATILGVSVSTVRRLVANGSLRHIPIAAGRKLIRFRRRDLEAYLDAQARGGTPIYADVARGRIDGQFKPTPEASR
jgi:excisionase family DNA binding protein